MATLRRNVPSQATEGSHDARIVAVTDIGEVKGQYRTEPKFKITFQMLDQDNAYGEPVVVQMFYTQKITRTSKLGKLLDDMGFVIGDNEEFDTDDLIGQETRVMVQHRSAGHDRVFTNIIEVESRPRTLRSESRYGV